MASSAAAIRTVLGSKLSLKVPPCESSSRPAVYVSSGPCLCALHLATLARRRAPRAAPEEIRAWQDKAYIAARVLRVMAAAAVASHFPGFSKWAYAEAHAHAGG